MKNKKILCLTSYIIISSFALSQTHKCGTMSNYQAQINKSKDYINKIQNAEDKAKEWSLKNKIKQSGTIVYVPVVFHCVYKNTNDVTYIPDSIFQRQVQILNETYGLTNSNFSNTRSIFDTIAADTEIRFCLALQDTLGNPTTGIMRYQSNQNWLTSVANDAIKTAYPPWNPSKYLNVWTCDMSLLGIPLVLGYAAFPGGPPSKDGVVLQAEFVGYQNNGTENNLGRTMVHEVGHWLGLRHIWGDGQNSSSPCDSIDYVDDTPHATDASQTDCDTTKNTCSNENAYWTQRGIDPPDMVENYMDYSKDGCMTMFTKGQKNRMWSFINTARSGLLNNNLSCNMVGTNQLESVEEDLTLFPNPALNSISIVSKKGLNQTVNVEFFDLSGRKVLSAFDFKYGEQINISKLPEGYYNIRLNINGMILFKKMIKN